MEPISKNEEDAAKGFAAIKPFGAAIANQFLTFVIVGLAAASVHYGFLIGFVEGWRIDPVPATLAGYGTGGLVSYALHRRFTYRSERAHCEATWRFILVAGAGFLITWALMFVLTRWFEAPYLPAQVAITGIVMFFSFAAHKRWTFDDKTRGNSSHPPTLSGL